MRDSTPGPADARAETARDPAPGPQDSPLAPGWHTARGAGPDPKPLDGRRETGGTKW